MAKKNGMGKNVLAVTGGIAILGGIGYVVANKLISNVFLDVGNPSMDNTPFANGYLRTNVPLTITNNNVFPIGISSFFGRVNYGMLDLADVSIPFGFSVPSGATRVVELNMDIPIAEVLTDIGALIQNGSVFNAILNKIELNGTVIVKGRFAKARIPLENIAIPIV